MLIIVITTAKEIHWSLKVGFCGSLCLIQLMHMKDFLDKPQNYNCNFVSWYDNKLGFNCGVILCNSSVIQNTA